MTTLTNRRPHGPALLRSPTLGDIVHALRLGWRDMRRAPLYGIFFSSVYVLLGWLIAGVTYRTGESYWMVLAVLAFPMIGSLAALGFYEISRRLEVGSPLNFGEILTDVWLHKEGQVPWLAVIIVVMMLFWFFLGHMLFALFLGNQTMTNVFSSFEVFLSGDGLMMLAVGTTVGAVFAGLIFAMTVVGLPMLVDRDVDFMTASLMSIGEVKDAPLPYLMWGGIIAIATFIALIPWFLGLFVVLPLFGHATWHLYRSMIEDVSND
ncbi:DUF2189 domain-containing protein [Nereida sp. MMG025]|uniref:DUF2189 domain-containing protein n=1 Tax=Nereida sp. MMG025 TaxID=2909981 RepID=UPI001F252C16|nr:DUF2189 domain-containing protein [Nereida sp. MMG025]MCF6443647.1 DUF2189 domain-containing protein [Nereida sp. MMG025]